MSEKLIKKIASELEIIFKGNPYQKQIVQSCSILISKNLSKPTGSARQQLNDILPKYDYVENDVEYWNKESIFKALESFSHQAPTISEGLRDQFFKDLTRKRPDGVIDFKCLPHNVLEWLRDKALTPSDWEKQVKEYENKLKKSQKDIEELMAKMNQREHKGNESGGTLKSDCCNASVFTNQDDKYYECNACEKPCGVYKTP